MMGGFDLSSPLVCEGVIGDGCGGGRIFFIKEDTLFVHDPITKENRTLLTALSKVKKISKSACIITLECIENDIEFDLSTIK